jgi:D-aminopeptidase
LAFTKEAQALFPGIETVAVKRGIRAGTGDNLSDKEYMNFTGSAIHFSPIKARQLIREGALRAITRAKKENFGIIKIDPPYERVAKFRPNEHNQNWTISKETHPSSIIELMNMGYNPQIM